MAHLDETTFVFYNPERPSESLADPRKLSARPRWQKLADRIGTARGTGTRTGTGSRTRDAKPLEARALLEPLPTHQKNTTGGTGTCSPLVFASAFARNIKASHPDVAGQELLLLSLCSVLSVSGRAAPEEVDSIMAMVSKSTQPRYLDRIKRGAKMANEVIVEWALATPVQEEVVPRLYRATHAVLQARITPPQWGLLNGYITKVKKYIISRPLPEAPRFSTNGPPLLIPCLIEAITNRSLRIPQICHCLGYTTELTSCITGLPSYELDIEETEQGEVTSKGAQVGPNPSTL